VNRAYHMSVLGLLTFIMWRILDIEAHFHSGQHDPYPIFMWIHLGVILTVGYGSLLYEAFKDKNK
jgi:hypothetical protein